MSRHECDAISERLVDYADGGLTGEEAAPVDSHLTECAQCRIKLDALRRSLNAAQSIWREAETGLVVVGAPTRTRPTGRRLPWMGRKTGLAAAAIVLMFGGSVALHLNRPRAVAPQSASPSVPKRASSTVPKSASTVGPSLAEIERAVQLAALPVQMLAAADYLAEQPGGRDIACERYQYIAAAYPSSAAATQSLQRRQELCPDGDD